MMSDRLVLLYQRNSSHNDVLEAICREQQDDPSSPKERYNLRTERRVSERLPNLTDLELYGAYVLPIAAGRKRT